MKIKLLCWKARRTDQSFEYAPGYVFDTDPDCRDYDWLAAYDDLYRPCEELSCPRERTILLTSEPTSIRSYSHAYTRQFGHLLTNRPVEAEGHPHYHLGRGYYYWFVGRDYDSCRAPITIPKTKGISACISAKQMGHTRHRDRFDLMTVLARTVPGLDWFGRGVRPFGKKFEVLDPYKYHVTIENHIAPHHWSEKIADAFLCECLPFYAGDPLLAEVFPEESFIPIPLEDPAEATRIINAAMAAGEYERRREAILEAKRLVLEKYNLWAQIINVIEMLRDQRIEPTSGAPVLYGRTALRWRSPAAALEDAWMHARQWMGFR